MLQVCLPVPLFHCFGCVLGVLAVFTHGASIVLPGEGFDALQTLAAVQQERCTALYGVSTMFIAQLAHPQFASFDLSTLCKGIMAGSPCPEDTLEQVSGNNNKSTMEQVSGNNSTNGGIQTDKTNMITTAGRRKALKLLTARYSCLFRCFHACLRSWAATEHIKTSVRRECNHCACYDSQTLLLLLSATSKHCPVHVMEDMNHICKRAYVGYLFRQIQSRNQQPCVCTSEGDTSDAHEGGDHLLRHDRNQPCLLPVLHTRSSPLQGLHCWPSSSAHRGQNC